MDLSEGGCIFQDFVKENVDSRTSEGPHCTNNLTSFETVTLEVHHIKKSKTSVPDVT